MAVFEAGPLGKELRLNEVLRMGPLSHRTAILTRRDSRVPSVRTLRKGFVKMQLLQSTV